MVKSCSTFRSAAGFTLVELLTVILIMGIMLGIAISAMPKLTRATGVSAGARGVANALANARQFALAQRTHTRVCFVRTGSSGNNSDVNGDMQYIAYTVMTSNIYFSTFPAWQYMQGYENFVYLPAGAVFLSGTNPPSASVGSIDLLPFLTTPRYWYKTGSFTYTNSFNMATNITTYLLDSSTDKFGVIEFDPRGFATRSATVTVAQGSVRGFGGSTSTVVGVNRAMIITDRKSSRIRIERP